MQWVVLQKHLTLVQLATLGMLLEFLVVHQVVVLLLLLLPSLIFAAIFRRLYVDSLRRGRIPAWRGIFSLDNLGDLYRD